MSAPRPPMPGNPNPAPHPPVPPPMPPPVSDFTWGHKPEGVSSTGGRYGTSSFDHPVPGEGVAGAVSVRSNAPAARLLTLRRWAYGWSAVLVVLFAFAVAGSGEFADVGAPLVLFGLFAWQALFATPRLLWGAR